MGDCVNVEGRRSEANIAMDEENSDAYEQEECVDPSMGLDDFDEDSNDTGEDIAEVGTMDKGRIPQFNRKVCIEPFVGMEFESYVAAGKFYSSYARSVGFETKIRQSRSNRMVGKWYVQFSCNKEGFRRAKPEITAQKKTDGSSRPDIRCGCLATMKVKLVGHNKWRVFKVNLAHNHAMNPSKAPQVGFRKILENSSECGQDGCGDPSCSMEGIEEDPDEMEEETSELNTIEMENTSECNQDAYVEPTVGMEFDSYIEAGRLYNSYARHMGFETKIRQSRSNLRHGKRYVQFSCNKEGFKRAKTPRTTGIRRDRPDVRCGCLATMKIKLTGQNKWRVFHVNLIHNHEIGPRIAHRQNSCKRLKNGLRSRPPISVDPEANNPSQTCVMEAEAPLQFPCHENNSINFLNRYQRLELGNGDLEAMHIFFERTQSRNSSFFYSLDLNDEGHVRNVFWVDSRSRASYEYFGDVVTLDTAYLTNNYKLKLALFVGVNHHGQLVPLGCGLLSSETKESFLWLLRTWLLAMSDHSPYAIISDQIEAIQGAVAEVLPHSHYRFCLSQVMKKVSAEFGSFVQYNDIKKAIKNIAYNSLRVHEFEREWNEMIEKYALYDNQWLNTLYSSREKWVPCFLKHGFWAGMSSIQYERAGSIFDDYVQPDTRLREFFERYELALNAKYAEEAFTDFTNFKSQPSLDQVHWFEAQLINVYTLDIFKKFQQEVSGMVRCYDMSPIHGDDAITTYMLKERLMDSDGRLLPKEYEVFYNKVEVDVTCICNLFQFEGFLCRHSLYILQNHGVVEIPSRYIIARWRKDYKQNRSLWYGSTNTMLNAATQWQDILHHKCRRILEEGAVSERGYLAALQVLDEGLQKVILANDAAVRKNVGQSNSGVNGDVLENAVAGNNAIFYPNMQGRDDEPNTNRVIFDVERTANGQKSNQYPPFICDSCLAGNTSANPSTNASKKRRISPAASSGGNCNQSNEIMASPTTQDLLGFSTNQQCIPPMAPYFYGPPTFPGYVPLRYPSAPVMLDNGFIPFNQAPMPSQQTSKQ